MRVVVALLGLAGATLYGSYSYFAPGSSKQQTLAEVTQIVTGTSRSVPPAAASRPDAEGETARASRIFSPQQPLITPMGTAADGRGTEPPRAAVVASRRSDPFDTGPAVRMQPSTAARTEPGASAPEPLSPPAAARAATSRPMSEEARVALVRDLQKELRRVGCYDGEITGSWGSNSRRAMGDFTGRVNASLPVEAPDYVLLALVRGHAGQACGTSCGGGRCPAREPLIAQGAAPAATSTGGEARGAASGRPVLDDKGLEGRAAAMASQLAAAPLPQRTKRVTETTAFPAAQTGAAPSGRTQQPARTLIGDARAVPPAAPGPAAMPSPAPAPLPGRMAIGATGPIAEPQQPVTGRVAALPDVPPSVGGSTLAPSRYPEADTVYREPAIAGGPPPSRPPSKRSARNDGRSRYAYSDRPYYYYERPSPPPSSSSRARSGGSLKNAANVRDFFFGPGRTSF